MPGIYNGAMPSSLICLTPQYTHGGPASFQNRLQAGLARRGVGVTYDLKAAGAAAVLVVGATRHLGQLARLKRQGVSIVQRLNGMNWIHRRRRTGLRHYMRAEYGNLLLAATRGWLADKIVYQSEFSQAWWQRVYRATLQPAQVIYNGVDLDEFQPQGPEQPPAERVRLLVVEGSLGGGYETGLETAVGLAEAIAGGQPKPVELWVAGKTSEDLRRTWQERSRVDLRFVGLVERSEVPALDRSAHLLYAADINAACPNTVIEAMACGLPVAAFDTGALKELVTEEAGRVAPYGGDPGKLDPPDIPSLASASLDVLAEMPAFRAGARRRAEQAFGLDQMVDHYASVLLG